MGADITPTDDGMIIQGGRTLHGAKINSYLDHRIAMAFAIAALSADGDTIIHDSQCVDVSYPEFFGTDADKSGIVKRNLTRSAFAFHYVSN